MKSPKLFETLLEKLFKDDKLTPTGWLIFILMTVLVFPILIYLIIYLIYNWLQPASSSPSASPRNDEPITADEMSLSCTKPRPKTSILLIVDNPQTSKIIGALIDIKQGTVNSPKIPGPKQGTVNSPKIPGPEQGTVNSPKIPGPETIAELLQPQYVDICVTQLSTARQSDDNSLQWLRLYVNAGLQYDIILYDESIVTKQEILNAGQNEDHAIFINLDDKDQVSPEQKNALLEQYTSPKLATILDDYFSKPKPKPKQ